MAILRNSEIREMNDEELDDKLFQLQEDLMKIRGVLASGGIPEDVGRAREMRRTIARIKTVKNLRFKGIIEEVKKPSAGKKKKTSDKADKPAEQKKEKTEKAKAPKKKASKTTPAKESNTKKTKKEVKADKKDTKK